MREEPIRLGVSSCLLGNPVRYDGGHKRDRFLSDVLGPFVQWVPVCPELEVGMGVPREPLRLVRSGRGVRMRAERSGTDHTRAMRAWSKRRLRELVELDLCGYVLKQDSPSCGLLRVRVYAGKGVAEKKGRGLFAEALTRTFPHLPVEEEGRLQDPALREGFIERVFAYRRLRSLFGAPWSRGDLVRFHSAHELQILSHSPRACAELGHLAREARALPRAALRERYATGFMAALALRATPRRHANAMHHMLRLFREALDATSKQELLALIDDYRRGLVPRVVPLTLIRHHVRRLDVEALRGQHYLEPHPKELLLRNHV